MLLAVFCLSSAIAQKPSGFTDGHLNGRVWVNPGMTNALKTMYLQGVSEVFGSFNLNKSDTATFWPVHSDRSIGEISQVIDQFYSDAANRGVPVLLSLGWVWLKFAGASPARLGEIAAELRKEAALPPR